MIHFSERIGIVSGYHFFLDSHPGLEDNPVTFTEFLRINNLLNEEAVKSYVHTTLLSQLIEGGKNVENSKA